MASAILVSSNETTLPSRLRTAPQWFTWLEDAQSYSLYAVDQLPEGGDVIEGNSAMANRLWQVAERFYRAELARTPNNVMAIWGLAEIAHAQGEFTDAISWLRAGTRRLSPSPARNANRIAP